MNVWIFQTGEPLHIDGGSPRPMRSMNLANALVDAGHDVVLWSSAFFHQEKRHRTCEHERIKVSKSLEIRLIPSPGYRKNIGLARLFDHAMLARGLKKILSVEPHVPDVAFIGYPPIEFAYVANEWLVNHGVPTMLDVKDQWPQIFLDPFPKILQPLVRIGLYPYFILGRRVMKEATAFCSMSQGFLTWMERSTGRLHGEFDCVIPLSPMTQNFPAQVIADAVDWWKEAGVSEDGRERFFFVGSLSRAFDFEPILKAASRANEQGKSWQFVICGDGAKADQISDAFRGLSNVVFPGWVDRPKVVALANMSAFGLAPYVNSKDFIESIPNKIIDYMSLGKPIVTPLQGEVSELIRSFEIGLIYEQNDGDRLYELLNTSCSDRYHIDRMSNNSLGLYKKHFCGEKVYQNLVDKLVSLRAIKVSHL